MATNLFTFFGEDSGPNAKGEGALSDQADYEKLLPNSREMETTPVMTSPDFNNNELNQEIHQKTVTTGEESAQPEEISTEESSKPKEDCPKEEQIIPKESVQPEDITPEESPKLEEITTKVSLNPEKITPDESPQTEEISQEESPQTEEISQEEFPQVEEISPEESAKPEEITSTESPQAEKMTQMEESPKPEEIIPNLDQPDVPRSIQGLDAPPLTPDQLKLIPKLMEVVHVGHEADTRTDQKWRENCPRELLTDDTSSEPARPPGKCMFGMVLTDSPRNHNWTAFRDLDESMKTGKDFNLKPDRREEIQGTQNEVTDQQVLDETKCPFLRSRDAGSSQATPDTLTPMESSEARAKCPFFKSSNVPADRIEAASMKPSINVRETKDLENATISELKTSNRVKMQEVKEALESYRKQLKEFQELQRELLYLRESSSPMEEGQEEGPCLMLRRPTEDIMMRRPREEIIGGSEPQSHVSSMTTQQHRNTVRFAENILPRHSLVDRDMFRQIVLFCVMFIVAHMLTDMLR